MRNIRITEQTIEELCNKVRTMMSGTILTKDNLNISLPVKLKVDDANKPTILVSDLADRKMHQLIQQCDKEVAWHGTVSVDAETNTYLVEDIFVFPQHVTGATVNSIDTEYGPWLMELDDDTFNKLRLHGHSHVNMGVTPSGVDTTYQEDLIQRVNDYYIFLILNKRGDYFICLYDVVNNLVYEKDDVYYDTEVTSAEAWAMDIIKKQVRSATTVQTNTVLTDITQIPVSELPVLKTWKQGWRWDTIRMGFVPASLATLTDYYAEQEEEAKKKKQKQKPGRKPKETQSAYKEYQQQVLDDIDRRNSYKALMENCEGNCHTCASPCGYYGAYRY